MLRIVVTATVLVLVLIGLAVGGCVYAVYLLWGECIGDEQEDPPFENLIELDRRHVVRVPPVGDVSDMRFLDEDRNVLLISGTKGAFELDLRTGRVDGQVSFDRPVPSLLESWIVDVDGDGEVEFARFESGWTPPTSVFERDGSVRWSVDLPARCVQPLDIDHDGRCEFFVGAPNDTNVSLIDCTGRKVWTRDLDRAFYSIHSFDVDGDGLDELLYTDGRALRVLDRQGNELFQTRPPDGGYVGGPFFRSSVPGFESARIGLSSYLKDLAERRCYYYEADATTYLGWCLCEDADPTQGATQIEGASDRLYLKTVAYARQAFPAGFCASDLRVRLYDEDREQLFEDRLERADREYARAEGAFIVTGTAPMRFLVGYGESIWEYTEAR